MGFCLVHPFATDHVGSCHRDDGYVWAGSNGTHTAAHVRRTDGDSMSQAPLSSDGRVYKTIYADPPWPMKWNASASIGKKHIDYPTMPISEICELPVYLLADQNCTLFMWTTNAFLPEALGVLRHWKFAYKLLFTWCKNNGMGGHPRNATEHMVIATRGEPESDRHAAATLNWLEHPRIGHSVKPEAFREIIERISPAPRLELFARRRVPGWDAWGNEVSSDVRLTA